MLPIHLQFVTSWRYGFRRCFGIDKNIMAVLKFGCKFLKVYVCSSYNIYLTNSLIFPFEQAFHVAINQIKMAAQLTLLDQGLLCNWKSCTSLQIGKIGGSDINWANDCWILQAPVFIYSRLFFPPSKESCTNNLFFLSKSFQPFVFSLQRDKGKKALAFICTLKEERGKISL